MATSRLLWGVVLRSKATASKLTLKFAHHSFFYTSQLHKQFINTMADTKPTILTWAPISEDPDFGVSEFMQEKVKEECNIVWYKDALEDKTARQKISGIFGYGKVKLLTDLVQQNIEDFPELKVISSHSAGLDYMDIKFFRDRNVRIGYIPELTAPVTADMAFTLLMAAARRVREGLDIACGPEQVSLSLNTPYGVDIYDKTLGIVGLGRIGSCVAKRASGFDMKVLYHSRNRRESEEKSLGCEYVGTLDELLKQSDFVVLCCPLTPETKKMVGAEQLGLMKKTAVLVNVGRGPLVDTDALTEALKTGQIFGAGLDVTDPEPLPAGHPLRGLRNCVICPHWGSQTEETRLKMSLQTFQNVLAGIRGEEMHSEYL